MIDSMTMMTIAITATTAVSALVESDKQTRYITSLTVCTGLWQLISPFLLCVLDCYCTFHNHIPFFLGQFFSFLWLLVVVIIVGMGEFSNFSADKEGKRLFHNAMRVGKNFDSLLILVAMAI